MKTSALRTSKSETSVTGSTGSLFSVINAARAAKVDQESHTIDEAVRLLISRRQSSRQKGNLVSADEFDDVRDETRMDADLQNIWDLISAADALLAHKGLGGPASAKKKPRRAIQHTSGTHCD